MKVKLCTYNEGLIRNLKTSNVAIQQRWETRGRGTWSPPTLFLKLNFSFEFVYFIELRSVFISTIPTDTENTLFEIMSLHCTLKGDPDTSVAVWHHWKCSYPYKGFRKCRPQTSKKLCLYTFNDIVFLSLNKKQFCRNPTQNLTCSNNYKLNDNRSDCVGEFYSLQTVQLHRLFLGCCRITEENEKCCLKNISSL